MINILRDENAYSPDLIIMLCIQVPIYHDIPQKDVQMLYLSIIKKLAHHLKIIKPRISKMDTGITRRIGRPIPCP